MCAGATTLPPPSTCWSRRHSGSIPRCGGSRLVCSRSGAGLRRSSAWLRQRGATLCRKHSQRLQVLRRVFDRLHGGRHRVRSQAADCAHHDQASRAPSSISVGNSYSASAGIVAVALPIVFGLVQISQVRAQSAPANPAQDIAGTWQGTLHAGKDLRTVVKISKADGGGYKAVFYSIDQGGDGIPVTKITLEGTTVKMSLTADWWHL